MTTIATRRSPTTDNPDFNFLSFRTTNVLRWEYRPGSALFVVWQQGREDVPSDGDFQLGRDLSGTFDAPATNVVPDQDQPLAEFLDDPGSRSELAGVMMRR